MQFDHVGAGPRHALAVFHEKVLFRQGPRCRPEVAGQCCFAIEQHIETLVKFEDGRSGMVAADLRIEDAKIFPAAAARKAA